MNSHKGPRVSLLLIIVALILLQVGYAISKSNRFVASYNHNIATVFRSDEPLFFTVAALTTRPGMFDLFAPVNNVYPTDGV